MGYLVSDLVKVLTPCRKRDKWGRDLQMATMPPRFTDRSATTIYFVFCSVQTLLDDGIKGTLSASLLLLQQELQQYRLK